MKKKYYRPQKPESEMPANVRQINFLDDIMPAPEKPELLEYLEQGIKWAEFCKKKGKKAQQNLLKEITESHEKFWDRLPVYSAELWHPDPERSRAAAPEIVNLREEEALLMLQSLPMFPDTGTRLAVEEAISELKKMKSKRRLHPRRPPLTPHKAFVVESYEHGHMFPVLSVTDAGGNIHALFSYVDRWYGGIIDCSAYDLDDDEQLTVFIKTLQDQMLIETMQICPFEYCAWILQKAERLNLKNGHPVPKIYPIMRRFFWECPFEENKFPVKFGLTCQECGKSLCLDTDSDDQYLDACIIGDLALCRKCYKSKTHCECCGKRLLPDNFDVFFSVNINHVTAVCLECSARISGPEEE